MNKRLWAAAAAGAMLFAAGSALADEDDAPVFSSVSVFGDSLSDAGNLSLALGLGQQLSFTTNPGNPAALTIADHYGVDLGASLAGGTDYAWGGAGLIHDSPTVPPTVPTITQQVAGRLAAGPIDPNGLYLMWGGANDIFYYSDQVAHGLVSPTDAIAAMTPTAAQEVALISQLQAAGANTIVVFNLPNIGRTPDAQAAEAASPGAALLVTGMSQAFNTALNAGLAGKHGVVPVNINLFFAEVLENPGLYGFTNTTQPACTTSSALTCNHSTLQTANGYQTWLYADGVHPTEAAHDLTAQLVLSELMAPQQMSLLPQAALVFSHARTDAVGRELERASAQTEPGWRVFATGGYANDRTDAQLIDVPETDGDGLMVTLGIDGRLAENLTGGVAFTAGRNNVDWGGAFGDFDVNAMMATLFGQWGGGQGLYVNAQGHIAKYDFAVNRSFALGPTLRTESSNPDSWGWGARLGAGYWFGNEAIRTGPVASIDWQQVHIDDFAEHGGDSTAMTFGEQQRDSLVGEVGWAVRGQGRFQPYAEVACGHEFDDDRAVVTAGLVSLNGDFSMPGYKPGQDWVKVGAGLSANITDQWAAHVGYSGRFGDEGRTHLVAIGLSGAF
jgi:outer membrane lipase/esterase